MIQRFGFSLACAAVLAAAQVFPAFAQPVQRLKAKLTAFDGQAMTLEPDAKSGLKEPLTVFITPTTRYVGSSRAQFAAINAGDYVGAAVTEGRGGTLRSKDVFVYAPALRGSGEGRFPDGERLLVNGTVTAVQPTSADDKNDGTLTLHYRGAVLNGLGQGRTVCEGRAAPPAYASPLACAADATIQVLPGAQITALAVGDKSLLLPGSPVTVAMNRTADGKTIAAGVTVEPPPPPLEKPQSPN
ncbi:MAG: hypothetical protein H0U98_16600 [Alphaproteobacteria bacterium]|nr:hypothetical protein [Alphaproteobacteria bacterium]